MAPTSVLPPTSPPASQRGDRRSPSDVSSNSPPPAVSATRERAATGPPRSVAPSPATVGNVAPLSVPDVCRLLRLSGAFVSSLGCPVLLERGRAGHGVPRR